MQLILGTAYWPNLVYLYSLLNYKTIIDVGENYTKQSYKNRTCILNSNGVQNLIIPVQKFKNHTPVSQIKICYKENWQNNHYKSINSAYKNSPFFDFFEDEIKSIYLSKVETLFEFNLLQLNTIERLLRVKFENTLSNQYIDSTANNIDLRNILHPKKQWTNNNLGLNFDTSKPYYQTFKNDKNFTPNLSCLDLIFNCGMATKDYLSFVN